MKKGDTLLIYTDGLSEVQDDHGTEYGVDRLQEVLAANNHRAPREIISNCIRELNGFSNSGLPADDLTVMAIKRVN
jgi:sigma-B regulation protein RsbU (phosphoserine phosphatase)